MTYPAGDGTWAQFGVGGPKLSKSGSMIASSAPITVGGVQVATGASATGAALSLWTGTKAQYDALTKSATTIYVVTAGTAVTGDITVDEGVQTGDIAAEPPADEPVARSATTKSTQKK